MVKIGISKIGSPYVNTIMILTGLGIALNFLVLVGNLFNLSLIFNSPLPFSTITEFILTIFNIIIFSVYLTKLYIFPSKRIKWTDIVFGYLVFQIIIIRVLYVIETKAKISLSSVLNKGSETSFISSSVSSHVFTGIGLLLVLGIIWYTFRNHLKKQTLGKDYSGSLK